MPLSLRNSLALGFRHLMIRQRDLEGERTMPVAEGDLKLTEITQPSAAVPGASMYLARTP